MIESSLDDLGIVIFRCSGSITPNDIVTASNAVYSAMKEDPPSRVLWDTREAQFEWTLEEMSSDYYKEWVARANKYRSKDRIAIVVSFEVHRMITEMSRDALGFEFPLEIFDNFDVAYEWLKA